MLTKATEIDPEFAVAYAASVQCHVQPMLQGWAEDVGQEIERGTALIETALEKGSDDAEVLWRAGFAMAVFGSDLHRSLAMCHRAIQLNPNSAYAHQWYGWLQVYAGHYDEAVASFERARRLSPKDLRAFATTNGLCACEMFRERFHAAVALAREAIAPNPRFTSSWRYLIACLARRSPGRS